MAIREQLIIEAVAETTSATRGLADVAKAADAVTAAESRLQSTSAGTATAIDATTQATDAARTQFVQAGTAAQQFSDGTADVAKSSEDAKDQIDGMKAATTSAAEEFFKAQEEGQKFSDILKGFGEKADIIGGKIVQSLGGGAVVGALTGLAAGFMAVRSTADQLLSSSEKVFSLYGDQGRLVFDEVKKSQAALAGAFADTMLAGEDIYEMGGRLKAIFVALTDVTRVMLAPVKAFYDLLYGVSNLFVDLEANAASYRFELQQQAEETQRLTTFQREYGESIESVLAQAQDLLRTEDERTQAIREQNAARYEATAQAIQQQAIQARTQELIESGNIRASRSFYGLLEETKEANLRADIARQAAAQAQREYNVDLTDEAAISERLVGLNTQLADTLLLLAAAREKALNPELYAEPEERAVDERPAAPAQAFRPAAPAVEQPVAQKTRADMVREELELAAQQNEAAREQMEIAIQFDSIWGSIGEKLSGVQSIISSGIKSASDAITGGAAGIQKLNTFEETLRDIGAGAKQIAKQQLAQTFSALGTALGSASKGGDSFAKSMEAAAAAAASAFGDYFIAKGIAMLAEANPLGAAVIAAGVGLKAVASQLGGSAGAASRGGGGERGSSGSGSGAVAARPEREETFGYFEGGRSNVTIVTNDAASIRTMQNRLAFVGARGGSGV
jgi:hypothetical protein